MTTETREEPPKYVAIKIGEVTFNRAGCVVFNRAGKVLLCEQSKRKEGEPALSLFPKGHIEEGETLTKTAVREVEEECGVIVADVYYLGRTEYDIINVKNGEVIEHVVIAWFSGLGVKKMSEGDRPSEWVSPEVAARILTYDEHAQLLQAALCED